MSILRIFPENKDRKPSTEVSEDQEPSAQMDDDTLFHAALNNQNPHILLINFEENVTIGGARELLENPRKGAIIGPPIGIREYISRLNTVLLARNPISLDPDAYDEINQMNRELEETMPTTQDEIDAGNLGVYYRDENRPRMKNIFAVLRDDTSDLIDEIEKKIEFIYQQSLYADPDVLLMQYRQLKQLLVQAKIVTPEYAQLLYKQALENPEPEDPYIGGPGTSVGGM